MNDLLDLLKANQRRGSKPRCHWLTHQEPEQRAAGLTQLIAPWGKVTAEDICMPDGFRDIREPELHDAEALLPEPIRSALKSWWLAVSTRNVRTPNWDIASTCKVGDKPGLLLIEAKAHHGELQNEEIGKRLDPPVSAGSMRNHVRIGACIEEANIALAAEMGRPWGLARDHHYQMSNRFAWSWKVTEFGYHVILVYLGFIGCDDMAKDSPVIDSQTEWEELVRSHSAGLVPPDCWNRSWRVHGCTFAPLIRSLSVPMAQELRQTPGTS